MIVTIIRDVRNIRSVRKALLYLGQETMVTKDPQIILEPDGVILPGMGAFSDVMGNSILGFLGIQKRSFWAYERGVILWE